MTFQYSNHRLFVLFLMLSSLNWLPAQILTPVHWSQSVKELGSGEYELVFSAKMDDGWAIYSQTSDPNAAAPTEITIKAAPHFELIGKAFEKGELKSPLKATEIYETAYPITSFSFQIYTHRKDNNPSNNSELLKTINIYADGKLIKSLNYSYAELSKVGGISLKNIQVGELD